MSYIFFYENYDIFVTEQLCASLYKLMEMILIANQLKKTLVLPQFYFTPRNNELINKNNSLEIDRFELVDFRNVLNIDKIKEIVNVVTITDFFKNKKLNFTLISKPNDDPPYVNNKYHTINGILNVNKKIDIEFSSLSLLSNYDKFKDAENIIVHNYNRMGNPIWYKQQNLNFYKIRNHIKFNNFLQEKANINLDYNKTLMVHWRRGDFKLSMGDELETRQYYEKYNELSKIENLSKNIILRCYENKINDVFLLTNETDDNELSKLSNVLKEFQINTTIYSASSDNNYMKYLINDICGIIIGSKCKYQLHGYGVYDRMSQYGRWIIEENMENKIYFLE
jgi:hypothetical protein